MNKQKKEMIAAYMDSDAIPASQLDADYITGYQGIYNRYVKRLLDFFLSLLLVVFISPIYALVSALILMEDGKPILYRAKRGGYHGESFFICKFRSMVKNADQIGGGTTALHDTRITHIGSVIRKMKIDELPNLFNIVKGEMSFVGPRPELLKYVEQYQGAERYILEVRPGITDYSSIEFINLDEIVGGEHADEMYEELVLPKKNKLRVKYAAEVSFWTDVKIFVLTIWKVIEKSFGFLFKNKHR